MRDSFPEYNSIPVSASMFPDGHPEFKYEMLRTMTENNMQQTHSEVAPSLFSSASLPSASSSTIGSPYSGHALPVSDQMIYSASQYHSNPTIVYDDQFPHGFESAHFDIEAQLEQEPKLTGSFVGKYADLSSLVKRSSTTSAQELPSPMPPVSSPEPINGPKKCVPALPFNSSRSVDDAARAAVISTMSKSQPKDNLIFKSPAMPASAYPKSSFISSPIARRSPPVQHSSSDIQRTQKPCPPHFVPSMLPMQQYASDASFYVFAQASGNFTPPFEDSCSSYQQCSILYPVLSCLHSQDIKHYDQS